MIISMLAEIIPPPNIYSRILTSATPFNFLTTSLVVGLGTITETLISRLFINDNAGVAIEITESGTIGMATSSSLRVLLRVSLILSMILFCPLTIQMSGLSWTPFFSYRGCSSDIASIWLDLSVFSILTLEDSRAVPGGLGKYLLGLPCSLSTQPFLSRFPSISYIFE